MMYNIKTIDYLNRNLHPGPMGAHTTHMEAIMKISARNVIKGKVKKVTPGAVNTEVLMVTDGGTEVVSIITKESADKLKLAEGKDVYAVIKASNVMIAVD